jgi:hypothetical protein
MFLAKEESGHSRQKNAMSEPEWSLTRHLAENVEEFLALVREAQIRHAAKRVENGHQEL